MNHISTDHYARAVPMHLSPHNHTTATHNQFQLGRVTPPFGHLNLVHPSRPNSLLNKYLSPFRKMRCYPFFSFAAVFVVAAALVGRAARIRSKRGVATTQPLYGRNCTPQALKNSSLECDSARNLYCHPQWRTCVCSEVRQSLKRKYEYTYLWDIHQSRCVLVETNLYIKCDALHSQNQGAYPQYCSLDGQCQLSLGLFSQCNLRTCTCECEPSIISVITLGQRSDRTVRNIDGRCVTQMHLGEQCFAASECASIDTEGGAPALCGMSSLSWSQVCVCDLTTHTQVKDKCVKINRGQRAQTTKPSARRITLPLILPPPFRQRTPVRKHDPIDPVEPNSWSKPAIISLSIMLTILLIAIPAAYTIWKRAAATAKKPLCGDLSTGLLLSEDDVEIDRETVLGSGQNGIVYRGYFKPRGMHVAVKTSKQLVASEIYLRAILEEAKVLLHLTGHPNVVQFFGVCLVKNNSQNVYLISELCPLGSLEAFLRTKRHVFDFWPQSPNGPPAAQGSTPENEAQIKLSFAHLYRWAYQIASAMEFVSCRKVIHSDLAARNVLLASVDCVKLTDFGLSRRLYDNYTYMKTSPEPLPWKWLDYDALRFMIFTTQTDVWSFGITMWEIWTLGDVPYPGIITPHCQDFMSRLLQGLHPPKPEQASAEVYELMVKCWNMSPMERPSFSWIKDELMAQIRSRGFTQDGQQRLQDGVGTRDEADESGYLIPLNCGVKLTSSANVLK